ncbi:hypothetical protein IFM89_013121 [Coptis chinensis]|uniref:Disease resistance N-terminal domain-containing protein n=1 Tax=Coptis chinensis TaxID=261450 RepID=A0A835INK9_9MAGN|nr:hypothetical protein IFM89_013121 [Coptis chinensis]
MAQGAVEVLLGKVISLMENEMSILGGICREFNEVKSELVSMKFFLSDGDRRGVTNQGIRTWVEQVRDVAYDVEDVMDEFMYFVNDQRRITNFMGKQMNTIKNVWMGGVKSCLDYEQYRHKLRLFQKEANDIDLIILKIQIQAILVKDCHDQNHFLLKKMKIWWALTKIET